jgi:hypothetical protein
MQLHIKSAEDLAWLLTHTGSFRSGYVTDVHMAKRRLLDEATGREILTDTTVTLVIRYQVRGVIRVAKLAMTGVTDFSIFEQEGVDCSTLGVIHAEALAGRLRFWFDPQGELYVVCEEVDFEEVSTPVVGRAPVRSPGQWVFQAGTGRGPTTAWLLKQLDQAGVPCAWRVSKLTKRSHQALRLEGDLVPASEKQKAQSHHLHVQVYGPFDGAAFRIVLQKAQRRDGLGGEVLTVLADAIARTFSGSCLVGDTIIPAAEWSSWRISEARRLDRVV